MTAQEACENYGIPVAILKLYESWGLRNEVNKVKGAWQYDDTDLEHLSMIMTLHDIGFDSSEIEAYMRLMLKGDGTEAERLRLLNQKRCHALDDIHWRETLLSRLDSLRYEILKSK